MRSSLVTIFLVVFVDLLGFGIIIPILPYYAKFYGASAIQLGWLMVCYSGVQFLFSPFWGRLSDRYGRRPIILISIFGIGLSLVIVGWAPDLRWLFIGRLLAGFFGANIAAASAYIADITPPEKRAQGMGVIGAAFGLGFLFGPAIGGFLSQWGYGMAAYVAALLSFLNLIFATIILKEPQLAATARAQHRPHLDKKSWQYILRHPATGIPILVFFLVTTGFSQMETIFAFFILERFGIQADHAGYLLALMAIIMVTIQGLLIGKLTQNFGERKLAWAGTFLMAGALILASYSFMLGAFIVALIFLATGYGIAHPSLMSLVSRGGASHQQGLTLGIYQSAGSLARVVGPLAAGFLYESLSPSAPFLAASLLFFASFAILTLTHWLKQ